MNDQLSNLILARTRLTGIESNSLAASIRDEFVVIPRTDLPKVDGSDGAHATYAGASGTEARIGWDANFIRHDLGFTAQRARNQALAFLAVAEYLDAHPPVKVTTDEVDHLLAQVRIDMEQSTYWRARPGALGNVESYLESLRDHLGGGL